MKTYIQKAKALGVALKAAVYSYRMACLNKSLENIIGMEDDLTGLANRRAFNQYFAEHPQQAVALIDCDNFKQLNDVQGHEGGDRALCELADVLRTAPGYAARLGGDEFVVVFDKDVNVHIAACDILRRARKQGLSLSIGVCDHPGECKDRLKAADKAMYQSKERGKNRVTFWNCDEPLPVATLPTTTLQAVPVRRPRRVAMAL